MRNCCVSISVDDCPSCHSRRPGWFCDLSPAALSDYYAMSFHVMLPVGSVLFAEGQVSRNVSTICQGRVKLTKTSRDGKTLLVKVSKPGDVLGLSAALNNSPYEVTAQAIEPTQLKTFQRKDFLDFIKRDLEGSLHAAKSLNEEYRSALNDACRMALSSSIAGRVVHLLFELAVESGVREDSCPEISMALKHEDLASMMGSSRESVTRTLNDLRRQGLISIKGTKITILRKEALELLL